MSSDNPFFSASWGTLYEAIPFDQIQMEHYEPAFHQAFIELESEIEAICNLTEEPTFENTIVALERSGAALERVSAVFFNLLEVEATDYLMELADKLSPKLTESSNKIYLNQQLFERVRKVYDQRASLNLTTEEARLLEETFDTFCQSGANLSPADKKRYHTLTTELNRLSLTFDQHALKDKNQYQLLLKEEEDVKGLPTTILDSAAQRAKENGEESGWLFDLTAPSYRPFMRYATNRELREQMYRAFLNIGNNGNEWDNKDIIRRIINLRLELAQLMGYKTFAEYRLRHRMAKSPDRVYHLLEQLLEAYKPVAEKEYQAVQTYADQQEGGHCTVMPWDWSYYSEKLKDERFQINDEMLRPYFRLDRVKEGVFGLASRLYNISFKKNTELPVYHPDVEVYEVHEADGRFLGLLYTDFFPRKGKQSGAWMSSIKDQYHTADGKDCRPHILIVMNFTRPTADRPSLLTFDEVNTFLHEFGHSLHGLFAEGTYASLSGTSVCRDFVELPSQLMENWLTEPEFLRTFAVHNETGEAIPADLIGKLVEANNFNVGYACCRQLSFGFLDMAYHTLTEPYQGDISDFEKRAWARTITYPEVKETLMSSSFGHIFSGGYAAGYYGYKWAEVLDADAFSLFKETGIFNQKTAARFRQEILSRGNTEDPDILYRRFRGKDPDIQALLRRNGILPAQNDRQPIDLNSLQFREARPDEINRIMEMMQQAKEEMWAEDRHQWDKDYPAAINIEHDIEQNTGWVLSLPNDGRAVAYGAVIWTGEPAYPEIDGAWPMGDVPYVVVHRLAIADEAKRQGVATLFFRKVEQLCHERGVSCFRVDTNFDNKGMLQILNHLGFVYTGEIHYPRGDRMAFEKKIERTL